MTRVLPRLQLLCLLYWYENTYRYVIFITGYESTMYIQ